MAIKVFNRRIEIQKEIALCRKKSKSIGFVPTMGSLHDGHICLINKAKDHNDIVIASIFVNPNQFNDKKDFDNYPRDLQNDVIMLDKYDCDILFAPIESEIYGNDFGVKNYDLGGLDKVMEGKFRPNHFDGVATIIDILLGIIDCDNIYLGEKDYQQILIIKHIIKSIKSNVKAVPVETYREKNGLAYSSRNSLLSNLEKEEASLIYNVLNKVRLKIKEGKEMKVGEIKIMVKSLFESNKNIILEYFEISEDGGIALERDDKIIGKDKYYRGFVSAFYKDKVRLIDNLYLS